MLFRSGHGHPVVGDDQEAGDLVARQLVRAGDAVLVETPGYYPLFGKLRLAKARIVGVPRGTEGVDLDHLDRKIREHRPRLMFVQPMAHNPTGSFVDPADLGPGRRRQADARRAE